MFSSASPCSESTKNFSSFGGKPEVTIRSCIRRYFNQVCLLKRDRVRIGMPHLTWRANQQQEHCDLMKAQGWLHHVSCAEIVRNRGSAISGGVEYVATALPYRGLSQSTLLTEVGADITHFDTGVQHEVSLRDEDYFARQ